MLSPSLLWSTTFVSFFFFSPFSVLLSFALSLSFLIFSLVHFSFSLTLLSFLCWLLSLSSPSSVWLMFSWLSLTLFLPDFQGHFHLHLISHFDAFNRSLLTCYVFSSLIHSLIRAIFNTVQRARENTACVREKAGKEFVSVRVGDQNGSSCHCHQLTGNHYEWVHVCPMARQ